MARTGRRANALRLLLAAGGASTSGKLQLPNWVEIERAGLQQEVADIYRTLGGRSSPPRVRPGAWDITMDGIGVELDEELHFNRYRLLTFTSPLYDILSVDCTMYRELCRAHEFDCLAAGTWGKRWTSASAEREFGVGGDPRDLEGAGAPRWRQRAFYDFVKDIAPLVIGIPMARIAIWESVNIRGRQASISSVIEAADAGDVDAGAGTALVTLLSMRARHQP